MGILSIGNHISGSTGQQDKDKSKCSVKKLVVCSAITDEEGIVLAGLPAIKDPHPTRPTLLLKQKSAQRKDSNSRVWECELEYETIGSDETEENQGEDEDPTLELPAIRIGREELDEPCEFWFDSNNNAYTEILRNSVGDIYPNAISRKTSLCVITIQRNYGILFDALGVFYTYGNTVNSGAFFGFAAGLVLCLAPEIERKSKKLKDDSIFAYLSITYTFKVNRLGWDAILIDMGSHYYNDADLKVAFVGADGSPYVGLLNNGRALCDAEEQSPCVAAPKYLPAKRKYPRTDFSALGLPSSFADYRGWTSI